MSDSASPDANKDRKATEWLVQIFNSADLLIPPFVSMGLIWPFAKAIQTASSDAQRLDLVRENLRSLYDVNRLSSMLSERYSKIPHVSEFQSQIGEAIRAHFVGLHLASVCTLVPVIEGIVRKIAKQQGRDVGKGTRNLHREFEAIVERELSSPHCYGERLVMLENLRDFIRDRFLKSTDDFEGLNEFNRHGIVHGIYGGFGDELNFFRLITLLDSLCFCVGVLQGGVSFFAPEITPESQKLAAHYTRLAAEHGAA